MAIPKTREELVEQLASSWGQLEFTLEDGGSQLGERIAVDDWTVKDLLAVRAWWSGAVVEWIERGLRGESFPTPAEGYGWNQTPALNAEIVEHSRTESFEQVYARLVKAFGRVRSTVETLDDEQLTSAGIFDWAGRYPLVRWISMNTVRQYTTARTYVRRAARE